MQKLPIYYIAHRAHKAIVQHAADNYSQAECHEKHQHVAVQCAVKPYYMLRYTQHKGMRQIELEAYSSKPHHCLRREKAHQQFA